MNNWNIWLVELTDKKFLLAINFGLQKPLILNIGKITGWNRVANYQTYKEAETGYSELLKEYQAKGLRMVNNE